MGTKTLKNKNGIDFNSIFVYGLLVTRFCLILLPTIFLSFTKELWPFANMKFQFSSTSCGGFRAVLDMLLFSLYQMVQTFWDISSVLTIII